jgi:hypothetical protein
MSITRIAASKSSRKDPMPHYEKVTQIKADYPEATAIGGQHGVNHAREKGSYQADPFPLLKSRTEREVSHPGRIHPDYRL